MSADHLGRFINAFTDQLDLKKVGSECVQAKVTSHPGDNPADLLKLNIYGYLIRVHSNHQLEAETRCDIEVVSLLRRLAPDFKTIAAFRLSAR
ncbi:MAG: transposase [Geminicoccales bacterium]